MTTSTTPTRSEPMPAIRPAHRPAHPSTRPIPSLLVVVVGAIAAVLVAAGPAGAHVEADEPAVGPDGATTIDFTFDHGCDGQPTTSLRVEIPPGVTDVVPEPRDGWEVQVSATEFGWSGGSIPDREEATFRAAMRVSGEAGTTIYFPTLQGCPTAELAWIDRPDPGGPEPEDVAPSVTLTETVAAPPTTAAPTTAAPPTSVGPTTTEAAAPISQDQGADRGTAGLIVIIVVVAMIAGGAGVLYLRNRGKGRV